MSCLCCTGSDSSLPQAALFPPLPSFLSLLRSLYPSPSLAVTFSSSSLLGSPSSGCHARPRRTFQYEAACCSGFLAGTSLSQGGSATPGCVFSVRVCVCVCAAPPLCASCHRSLCYCRHSYPGPAHQRLLYTYTRLLPGTGHAGRRAQHGRWFHTR